MSISGQMTACGAPGVETGERVVRFGGLFEPTDRRMGGNRFGHPSGDSVGWGLGVWTVGRSEYFRPDDGRWGAWVFSPEM
ncbi:MAG: hypothetical protein AAFY65_15830 [Pseudomonadota bacterium]